MCFVDKLSVLHGELDNFYNTVRKIWDQNVSGYLKIQTIKTSGNHIKKTGALPRREVLPGKHSHFQREVLTPALPVRWELKVQEGPSGHRSLYFKCSKQGPVQDSELFDKNWARAQIKRVRLGRRKLKQLESPNATLFSAPCASERQSSQ